MTKLIATFRVPERSPEEHNAIRIFYEESNGKGIYSLVDFWNNPIEFAQTFDEAVKDAAKKSGVLFFEDFER